MVGSYWKADTKTLSWSCAAAELAGADVEPLFEHPRKVERALKTAPQGDLLQCQIGAQEQLFGKVQPLLQHVATRESFGTCGGIFDGSSLAPGV